MSGDAGQAWIDYSWSPYRGTYDAISIVTDDVSLMEKDSNGITSGTAWL